MSLPQESPVFITGAMYVEDRQPAFWSKLAGSIGHFISSAAHLAGEALPYVAKAASVYASSYASLPSSSGSMETTDDFEMPDYPNRTVRLSQPKSSPFQTIPDYKPSRIGQDALAQIQRNTQPYAQSMSQWRNQTTRILNDIARSKGLPSYEEFHRQNGIVPDIQPDQRGMGVERFLSPDFSSQSNGLIPEEVYPVQGVQQHRNYADFYQNKGSQPTRPDDALSALQRLANRRPVSPTTPIQSTTVNDLLEHAFADPTAGRPNIVQQAGSGRLTDNRLREVALNLDNMQARGQITPAQRTQLEMAAKALFANNWLHHDGQENSDGTVTYRGITTHKEMAPVLAYADAEQALNKDTHLSPQQDWMKQVEQTASRFIKGVANGIVAGAGPKAAAGEEGAYAVGDILGAVGINSAALLTGVFTPAVWAGYGLAREANREVDAGKPLNPAAIAASGAISAIPGTAAVKVPLGTLGRIGAGLVTGYASDIANRSVQQLGDTGHLDLKTLDYRPGLGTLTGGTIGLLSHPAVSQAFRKYLLGRQAQLRNGEKVPVSLDDFLNNLQKQAGWSDEELAFYTRQSSTPPVGSRYDRSFWSQGYNRVEDKSLRPIENAFKHADDHAQEFGLPKGEPYYLELADDTIPSGSHVKSTAVGKQYFYDDATDILYIREPNSTPKSMFKPGRGNTQKGWAYFLKQSGEYKGRLP